VSKGNTRTLDTLRLEKFSKYLSDRCIDGAKAFFHYVIMERRILYMFTKGDHTRSSPTRWLWWHALAACSPTRGPTNGKSNSDIYFIFLRAAPPFFFSPQLFYNIHPDGKDLHLQHTASLQSIADHTGA